MSDPAALDQEWQDFLAEPHVAVLSVASGELDNPDSRLMVFTIRPDRWLTSSFG